MALTAFQREVCRLLAAHRVASGERDVAGAVGLNELIAAPRISRDIDLFHDTDAAPSRDSITCRAMKRLAVSSRACLLLSVLSASRPWSAADRARPRSARARCGSAAPDQLAPLGEEADLTFLLVDVDANMVPGWPLLSAALTASALLWGSLCHHVKREASRFIPSTLFQGSECLSQPSARNAPSASVSKARRSAWCARRMSSISTVEQLPRRIHTIFGGCPNTKLR